MPISGGSGAVALRCGANWIRREEVEAIGSRDDDDDDAKIPAALGLRAGIGLAGGLGIWDHRWALGFFVFFLSFTVADVLKCSMLLIGLLQQALAPAVVDSRFTVTFSPRRTRLPAAGNQNCPLQLSIR